MTSLSQWWKTLGFADCSHTWSPATCFTDVALPELHQTVYSHVQHLLKEGVSSSLSFTSDIWSSDVGALSMLSLTAHWIDSDFQLHKAVLHAQEFSAVHGVKTTKDTLLEAVTKRFADIEEEPLYSLATVIDPRYKDRFYSEGLKTKTHRLLLGLITEAAKRDSNQESEDNSTGEPAEKVPRPGSLSSIFGEILAEETT
ncbi:hypothetical protein XENOCAPTIV_005538 [Xenoophorus captivus]|uniref:Uncharacterized protein n=1 Tax=Xenoophorus captivus TaxID=1517983 RepID=A0ABV0SEF3_9TELE